MVAGGAKAHRFVCASYPRNHGPRIAFSCRNRPICFAGRTGETSARGKIGQNSARSLPPGVRRLSQSPRGQDCGRSPVVGRPVEQQIAQPAIEPHTHIVGADPDVPHCLCTTRLETRVTSSRTPRPTSRVHTRKRDRVRASGARGRILYSGGSAGPSLMNRGPQATSTLRLRLVPPATHGKKVPGLFSLGLSERASAPSKRPRGRVPTRRGKKHGTRSRTP